VSVPVGTDDEALKQIAMTDEKVAPLLEGKTVVKVIVVGGKLVNIVVK
jgi:leucyl-tRNA synthetase